MPNPNDYKTEDEWMKICVSTMVNEGKEQSQAVAACMTMWKNKGTGEIVPKKPEQPEERKSKIDILSAIKKLVEKNGYTISDEKILEMFGVIQEGKGYLNKLNKRLDSTKDIHDIKVFPRKAVYIEKYDEYINFDKKLFLEMIEAFNCEKLFKPYVDEDHQLKEKFADIIKLYEKDDGLYAQIKLNEKGKLAIKNNIYSYISPEWGDRTDTDGDIHKNVLWAITLTNIPALEGENPKLQEQIKLTKNKLNYGGFKMVNNLNLSQKIAHLEGRISNYKLQDDQQAVIPPELLEAIQMLNEAVTVINELTQQKEEAVQGKEEAVTQKNIAEKTAMDYKSKFDNIEAEKKTNEKEAFFEKVVTDGQLDASDVDDWKLQYDKSEDFVRKILTSKPKKTSDIKTNSTSTTVKKDEVVYLGKKYQLTDEDYAIMDRQKFNKNDPKDIERYIRDVLAE